MFRVVNLRKSTLLEIGESVSLTIHVKQGDKNIVGAKFLPASRVDKSGDLTIPLDEFHDYDKVIYP